MNIYVLLLLWCCCCVFFGGGEGGASKYFKSLKSDLLNLYGKIEGSYVMGGGGALFEF